MLKIRARVIYTDSVVFDVHTLNETFVWLVSGVIFFNSL